MAIPEEYRNREQTYLKHRILSEYLAEWGHKLGSLAKRQSIKLWYVDCFAGPWQSRSDALEDTSIYIGLAELRKAAESWQSRGYDIRVGAIFVEKHARAFEQLRRYVEDNAGAIDARCMPGAFGDCVDEIVHVMGRDPAFVFVDPTGFKGVAMDYVSKLAGQRMRDVLVNVMFNDINRWKDDERKFLREQMRDFFGLGANELPKKLSEEELLRLYRHNLKRRAGLKYSADVAVPHPTHARTWFRLVVGGNHPSVMEVFRRVEKKVMGAEAATARTEARMRSHSEAVGQASLFSAEAAAPDMDIRYAEMREKACNKAVGHILDLVRDRPQPWEELWPRVLEELHLPLTDLRRLVSDAAREGTLQIEPTPSTSKIDPRAVVRAGARQSRA